MTVPLLTLASLEDRVPVGPEDDHGPAFRLLLGELGLDQVRLLRIMVALGDPRPRAELALRLAGQIAGRLPVAAEMLCLLRALDCVGAMLLASRGDDDGMRMAFGTG